MLFSILHISDLHRDPNDEIANAWLLDSLDRDFDQFDKQEPKIVRPSLCIVSGDLVRGIKPSLAGADEELMRQYDQAEHFLVGLADRFFGAYRHRVMILPGNHDVCFNYVMNSVTKIEIPTETEKREALVRELFSPNSRLRWSWRDMCFFRIVDNDRYLDRFRYFATTYRNFYKGQRHYALAPGEQFDVFDFRDLGFCVVALNSCFNNDPLRRAGGLHPDTLTEACRALRHTDRAGWITAAAWHHNIVGGPTQDDYLDPAFLQLLMDSGATLGFHGHQNVSECFEERYRLGPNSRKITIISASTLCAEPRNLKPGVPRSYNIVEIDTDAWSGRVHQRQMVNMQFNLPVWGPGHFISNGRSFFDFELCKPLLTRPPQLDIQQVLDQADRLLGSRQWREAIAVLGDVKENPLARSLLVRALDELGDGRLTISTLWPPLTNGEAVTLGGAVLESGTPEEAEAFARLDLVSNSSDASVREISHRVSRRRHR
jgi:hypothetical protein